MPLIPTSVFSSHKGIHSAGYLPLHLPPSFHALYCRGWKPVNCIPQTPLPLGSTSNLAGAWEDLRSILVLIFIAVVAKKAMDVRWVLEFSDEDRGRSSSVHPKPSVTMSPTPHPTALSRSRLARSTWGLVETSSLWVPPFPFLLLQFFQHCCYQPSVLNLLYLKYPKRCVFFPHWL